MRVSICVGNYAIKPYKVKGTDCNVYCMEELCYCIRENAFLLDMTLMNEELVDWIGTECGLKDLASQLHPMVHKKGSLSDFVTLIMEYVGLYESGAIRQAAKAMQQGTGLSGMEKKKTQIDYFAAQKKYAAALRGYDALLAQWKEEEKEGRELPPVQVKASILHNKGVVFSRLMLYEQAGECFQKAYRIAGEEEEYLAFLAAKRMRMKEKDYISFAAEHGEHYETLLELERKMERIQASFEEQEEYEKILRRRAWREGNEKQKYYEDNESLVQTLKNNYRECVRD